MDKISEGDLEYRHGDSGPKYLFRGPHMEWGVMRLKPGETMGQHGHRETEEFFHVIEGACVMVVDGERQAAAAGDAFRIVPGEMHDIENTSNAPVKLVFMKAPYNPEDKIA
ncbi:MAG: cupin domain-containing protein [Armatimonadota bacterium]